MATTAPIVIPVKTPGLSQLQKMEMRMKALERQVEKLNKDLVKNAAVTKGASKAAATATGNVQRMGVAFRTTAGFAVAAFGAVTQLSRSLKTLAERESDTLVLARNLENIGQGTEKLEELQALADELDLGTLFNSEDFNKGFALLTSFKAIGVDSYERVSKAAADLATITGTDLKSAQLQLAKALENPVEGMSALSRSGTTFTKTQKEFVKQLVESNQALEAQNYILSIVEGQYRGAAQAAAGGYAGAVDTLSKRWRDLNEQIGKTIQPAATAFLNALAGYLEVVKDELVKTAKALEVLSGWIQSSIGWIQKIGTEMQIAAAKTGQWFLKLSELVGLRSTFEGWGSVLSNEIVEIDRAILRSLPIIGQYFTALDALRRLRDGIAGAAPQGTDVDNNPLQGADLDMNAIRDQQRWADLMKGFDLTNNKNKTGGVSELEKQRQELERQFEAGEKIRQGLERQMQMLSASSDLEKERLQIVFDLEDTIERINKTAAPSQREGLIMTAQELARIKDAQAILEGSNFGEMSQWYAEQSAMTQELGSEYEGLANSIASSMTGAFKSIIDGSKSAEEAFSDMLMAMADALINYAMEAIAQYIAIGIARMFAGMGGGGSGYSIPDAAVPKTSGINFAGAFADGGYMPPNSVALVGERGPELISTGSQPLNVTSNEQSQAAMARYSPGNEMQPIYGEPQTAFKLETTVINGVEYATVAQVEEMGRSATMAGAKQGEAMTLSRLQNSRSSRQRIGL